MYRAYYTRCWNCHASIEARQTIQPRSRASKGKAMRNQRRLIGSEGTIGLIQHRGLRALLAVVAIMSISPAKATQIIPGNIEYSNDTIEQAGQLQACIITVGIISPPAPEIVNFQLLYVRGRVGFKVTAGDLNWKAKSLSAKRISAATFSTGQFNHPDAFKTSVTPEGQFVGFLTDVELTAKFIFAFAGGNYSIQFQRTDLPDEHVYYLEKGPEPEVVERFRSCVNSMM
jgi:hypothetical protein